MIPITQMYLTNHNRPKKKLKKVKAIVIHWTANENKGASALANRNYFNSTDRACSAQFIVDDHSIICCVPDDELAYAVGANKYTAYGNSLVESTYTPNFMTVSIEMCVNSDGDYNKTYQNTVELSAYLLKKHNLTIDNLVMHYHITGKNCHKYMVEKPELWNKFKQDVTNLLNPTQPKKYYIVTNYIPPENQYGLEIYSTLNKYFSGLGVERLYTKFNERGIWFESQYLSKENAQLLADRLSKDNLLYKLVEE